MSFRHSMDRSNKSETIVLVTGSSGYLAAHICKLLLAEGYTVRGTVRSLNNKTKVKPLYDLSKGVPGKLDLVEADLEDEASWTKAVNECKYVLHVASPFPIVANDSIIKTAVDGTLNVLRACAKCRTVEKVVVTSSCAAINEGHDFEDRVFYEDDWTNVKSNKVLAYSKSKTEAEKAAWDFVRNIKDDENQFKLTCLNPTLIVGPILIDTQGTSISTIRRFLNNEMPMIPGLQLALVDVVDVARAHILSMTNSKTDGERILITAQPSFWFRDISKVLAKEFQSQGYYLPRYQAPYIGVWLYSFFDSESRQVLQRLGRRILFDNSKAKSMLGIDFKNPEISLVEMAYSMIERGIIPKTSKYRGPSIK